MMKTVPEQWLKWDQTEALPFAGGATYHVRSFKTVHVSTETGLPVAMGSGEMEIQVSGEGQLNFRSEGDIWLRPNSRIQDRLQMSEKSFTSYDRPSPLTPEMAAIQRMMRRNELERERDRQDFDRRISELGRQPKGEPESSSPKGKAKKAEKVSEGQSGSNNDFEKQGGDSAGKDAEAARGDAGKATGDGPSDADSKGGGKAGDSASG